MKIHLLDGTYELFRHHFAVPPHRNEAGEEVAAVRGVVRSVLSLFEQGVTHLGVATDHVVESFRNELWPGYKTGEGVDPDLLAQFPLLEEALRALGVVVWAMVEHEADDALASAAAAASADPRVEQVLICTPDKDLAQSVVDRRVVQFDRRKREMRDEAGVVARFGVPPQAIPDYLALVGDSADGFPGLKGWGPRSAATLLARYGSIEYIPDDPAVWEVEVRGAGALAAMLAAERERAYLFKRLASLVTDIDLFSSVDEIAWRKPTDAFPALCARIDAPDVVERVTALTTGRAEARSPGRP